MVTIAEFQATSDAKEWYRLVNSDLFKRVLQCFDDNSIARNLSLIGYEEIKQYGPEMASQIKGWEHARFFLTQSLLAQPETPLPDPTYQEDA